MHEASGKRVVIRGMREAAEGLDAVAVTIDPSRCDEGPWWKEAAVGDN
jgi:hypothetical protein